MNELNKALSNAFDFVIARGEDIPADIWSKSIRAGVFKAEGGDLSAINARYHSEITAALLTYLEGGNITSPRNRFKKAMIEAFGGAADLGWAEGGGELPFTGDSLDWFNVRTEAEIGYIDMLFQQAKELRGTEEFEPLAFATEHADGYVNTLREIYNNLKLRAGKDFAVTFDGTDGARPCDTCKKLKGKRHKISWFIAHNFIPPHGSGLQCSKGGRCMHILRKDDGTVVTI